MSGDDTRYIVWSFQGERLFQHQIKYFYQILWRPRPNSIKELKMKKQDKQSAKTRLNNGWDITFKEYDMKIRGGVKTANISKNLKKQEEFDRFQKQIQKRSNEILRSREIILKKSGYSTNWTWAKIKHQVPKGQQEWRLTKEAMRRILSGDNVDLSKYEY